MNFFKSVFTDDPDPPTSNLESQNPDQTHEPSSPNDDGSDPNSDPTDQVWSFGGLMKTLQVKSDWIDTYRRDLEEFGSGLKKETEVFREVASRAVKDLPGSIDVGASKAQISLESMGQAFDSIGSSVWKSTADIISHGKESLILPDYDYSPDSFGSSSNLQNAVSSGRYSRFDAQLRAIQCDVNTYVEDPDDVSDYNEWVSGFNLEGKTEEIEALMKQNGSIEDIYDRVVPDVVEHDVFWCRYYYRVHRLQQAENVRAKLVNRAIAAEDEEELSWDVDDDDEEEEVKKVDGSVANVKNVVNEDRVKETIEDKLVEDSQDKNSGLAEEKVENSEKVDSEEKSKAIESINKEVSNMTVHCQGTSEVNNDQLMNKSDEKVVSEVKDDGSSKKSDEKVAVSEVNDDQSLKKSDEKVAVSEVNDDQSLKKSEEKVAVSEGKTEHSESGKDSDISVVSTQPSPDADDMGWDEIEDIDSGDEKKGSNSGGPSRDELRKRLSVADDDEDLSWDIEDDD